MMPNQDQITGILHIIIPVVCTWLAAKGFSAFSDAGIVAEVTTVVISLVAVVWSIMTHTASAKLRSAAAVDPQVQIQVPRSLKVYNKNIASLVHDDSVPNVTKLDEKQPPKDSKPYG